MSMKRFLNRSKSDADKDKEAPLQDITPLKTNSSRESPDSFNELPPMFETRVVEESKENNFNFNNDLSLNLNPSILDADLSLLVDRHHNSKSYPMEGRSIFTNEGKSVFTKDSAGKSSLFSNRFTLSTKQSTKQSSINSFKRKESFAYGRTLQIVNISEETQQDTRTPSKLISDKLHTLSNDLQYVSSQLSNELINITTGVVNSIDCFKKFVAFSETLQLDWNFTTFNNSDLRRILKIYLNFYDNLLRDEVYIKLKLLLVKNFNDFSMTLKSNNTQTSLIMSKPQNFPIGVNRNVSLPNEDVLERIMEKMALTSIPIKEQNGSFIAPIARGVSKDLNILCLYFGYPNPNEYHLKLSQTFYDMYEDVHVMVVKNQMDLASLLDYRKDLLPKEKEYMKDDYPSHRKDLKFLKFHFQHRDKSQPQKSLPQKSQPAHNQPHHNQAYHTHTQTHRAQPHHNQSHLHHSNSHPHSNPLQPPTTAQKFKLPFRIPTDISRPPMSLSLSVENSSRTSGTVGGYIYPKVDLKKQPHLEAYANSKFAISCGHVCLDSTTNTTTDYPHVSAPLSVFISLYKQALLNEYQKVDNVNDEVVVAQSKVAYGAVLKQLEEMFPMKKVKVVDPKTKKEIYEMRNLPRNRFGQIIWGERTLMNIKNDDDDESKRVEKKLSDLAIIKVNKNLTCEENFLGDDIAFNEFDPALIFDNLYVRAVINLERNSPKPLDLNIDEVDSQLSNDAPINYNGMSVFKYGSTTKFTKGNLNGIKLVYWLDGAIHSSEFIVNSVENNSAFAAGGDSGSWILTKLEDIDGRRLKGLGVVGMLHSYDGEFKQFGLFTPMCEILQRLEEVTGISWGVVGAVDEKGSGSDVGEVTSDEDTGSESENSEYESGEDNFDDAFPPEID